MPSLLSGWRGEQIEGLNRGVLVVIVCPLLASLDGIHRLNYEILALMNNILQIAVNTSRDGGDLSWKLERGL